LSETSNALTERSRRVRRRRRIAAALRGMTGPDEANHLFIGHEDHVAQRILEIATETGIVTADADLPDVLARLDLGESLPPEAVIAVAGALLPLLKFL
jgi:type III secretion system FlhB-like substrate exporter